jgi:hypothetical protein
MTASHAKHTPTVQELKRQYEEVCRLREAIKHELAFVKRPTSRPRQLFGKPPPGLLLRMDRNITATAFAVNWQTEKPRMPRASRPSSIRTSRLDPMEPDAIKFLGMKAGTTRH